MNARRFRVRFALLSVLAVGGAAALILSWQGPDAIDFDLPTIDLSASEPQVAACIDASLESLRSHGASAVGWAELAQKLHAHGFLEQAVPCYAQARVLAPKDYRWPYLAALAAAKQDVEAARVQFEAAADLAPDNPAFYINFGDLLMGLGLSQPAGAQYRRGLELDPSAIHAFYGLARIALLAGDLPVAREMLERIGDAGRGHSQVHTLMAQILSREGDADGARRQGQLARAAGTATRAFDPVAASMAAQAVSSSAHGQRGTRLAKDGDFAAAEHEFREVLKLRPGSARDYANLGGALARQRKTRKAIAQFKLGLEIAPDDVELLSNYGLTLAESGDPEGGIRALTRALELDDSFVPAHHNLGLLRERQGDLDRAIHHYRQALLRNPASTDVHNDLGGALAKRGRINDAIDAWSAALTHDAGNLAARYNLALALTKQGRHADAVVLLEEGYRRAPNSSRFIALLAWERATAPDPSLRDGAMALRLAQRLYAAAPRDPRRADLLAAALAENGQFQEAARTLEAVLATRHRAALQLAAVLRQRAALYHQGRAYRQPR